MSARLFHDLLDLVHLSFDVVGVVPLSEITKLGITLRDVIRTNAFIKGSCPTNMSSPNGLHVSLNTWKDTGIVLIELYLFVVLSKVPAKSIPILLKALSGKVNLDVGRESHLLSLRSGLAKHRGKHVGQLLIAAFTVILSNNIQNRARRSAKRCSTAVQCWRFSCPSAIIIFVTRWSFERMIRCFVSWDTSSSRRSRPSTLKSRLFFVLPGKLSALGFGEPECLGITYLRIL